jgi:tetratricopeptide (TPR) repeat protein
VAVLRLAVVDWSGPDGWRWVLTDAAGTLIAGHEVRLDAACWQYEAFTDLLGYLSWNVAPDQRVLDEARVTGDLGAWIGAQVLGPVAAAVAGLAPATVRVVLSQDAAWLAFRPLELAHAGGKPLAAQDVTLVMDTGTGTGAHADRKAPMGDRLRVLGLFSLTAGGKPLNLRRERQSLVRLIERIAANGRAADVRVLQYGVTRDRLRDVLEEAEGWDIIHISGHGAPGELLLETAAGMPDRVTATELASLLGLARERVGLVTVSACWSASLTAAQERRLLGLPVSAEEIQIPSDERFRVSRPAEADYGTLATALAGGLDCAVLAMRYPVGDEFAVALSEKLYELLAEQAQQLPRAVGLALRHLARDYPALSVATPALFGARAIDLTLAAPKRTSTGSYATGTGTLKMAGFPPPPERFVGRVGVMTRASAALAVESGIPGVLLHGMPGCGKTACALELASGLEHAFERLIWYKAPDDGMAVSGTLTHFALTLERYLDGFQIVHLLTSADGLGDFLARLTTLMEESRLLIVIDNIESLISEGGEWRDDRWGTAIGAMTARQGPGRLILTSRRVPSGLTGAAPQMETLSVDALSDDEALLLARELPHLKALIDGKLPGIDHITSRRLVRSVLNAARGHPKLLELADGQVAHPARLAALVEAGDTAPESGPAATTPDYWQVLAAWTRLVADTLAPGERALFWFLCCLEEPDRRRWIVGASWADLWQRLGRDGEPPDLDQGLAAVSATSLVTIRPAVNGTDETYPVHPGVAEAGRGHAGQLFRDAADTVSAGFWEAVHLSEYAQAGGGNVDTGLLVRAGLAAVPYLLRQQQWDRAAGLLEGAFVRDPSRANAAAVLPAIEEITRHEPRWAGVLGKVLAVTDPAAAVVTLRAAMADAATRGDYRAASANAGRLLDLCRNTGRLAEALDAAERKAGYTRQAGLGPWDQLADEVWRLQVLASMGNADQVLDEVARLRARMATLPATRGPGEGEAPWHVREALLDTGRYAAMLTGQHAQAIPLIAEVVASQRDRHAPAAVIARTRYNNYYPLLHLGRTEEALAVLRECRQVFRDARDTLMLGKTLSALADVEEARGHGEAAIRLERDGLRYAYLAGDAEGIAIGYHNLGNHLSGQASPPAKAFVSHLTSALICTLIGNNDVAESVEAAAADLRGFGAGDLLLANVADLCDLIGDIPGTNLPGLIEQHCPSTETAEHALRDLIAQAQRLAVAPPIEANSDPA